MFKINIVQNLNQTPDQLKLLAGQPYNVTSEFVQMVIKQFLVQLAQLSIQNEFTIQQIFDTSLQCPSQVMITEQLNAIFVQFAELNYPKVEAELLVNKVY